MQDLATALRGIVDVDDDLDRRPSEIGVQVTAEVEPAFGDVHPSAHPWVVQLDPVLLALPLPRTLLLAAAGTGLIELVLPVEAPEALLDLLFERSGLTLDQATNIVDLTVDLLDEQLHVYPSLDAGLASSGYALAHADRILAGAGFEHPDALARAAALTIDTFDELGDAQELADHLGPLGLAETAALVETSAA